MSVHVVSWVWTHSRACGLDLLVLLAIADQADDQGLAWPGVKNIAKRCRISERTVRYRLASLEAMGELQVVPRYRTNGSRRSNAYVVVQGRTPLHDLQDPPAATCRVPLQLAAALEPSLEPSLEPASSSSALNTRTRARGCR